MLTPPAPNPKNYELGVDSPRYKKDLAVWKARKQEERDHPERFGEVPLAATVASTTDLAILSGKLETALQKIAELEAKLRK